MLSEVSRGEESGGSVCVMSEAAGSECSVPLKRELASFLLSVAVSLGKQTEIPDSRLPTAAAGLSVQSQPVQHRGPSCP